MDGILDAITGLTGLARNGAEDGILDAITGFTGLVGEAESMEEEGRG